MNKAATAWAGPPVLLGLGALAASTVEHGAIDWQPALAFAEPWRAFSAAFVHYSGLHLAANLAGAVLVAALGIAARVPARMAWAWWAAWPLTQLALLVKPELAHFGGLSGVLHAGVAVVAAHLLLNATDAQRLVGAALLAGLVLKIIGEAPWGPALRHPPGWDIAVAPLAHATGLVAGLACAIAAHALARLTRAHVHDR